MRFIILLLVSISFQLCFAQDLVQRLGYPEGSKLLIVHADDLGVANSVNRASMKAYLAGAISSGSIMVPCPWFAEIAKFFNENPELDYGLHLTLTNEWKYFNWGGTASAESIPSLLNENGFMFDNSADVLKHASTDEIEIELRAQIEKALDFGLQPSHLDSHMGVLYQSPELLSLMFQLSNEYGIPTMYNEARLSEGVAQPNPGYGLGSIMGIPSETPLEKWTETYNNMLAELPPGIHQLTIHLAFDDQEMRAMTVGFDGWHAAWRQADLDYVTSPAFKEFLDRHSIKLVTWRQIQGVLH